MLGVAVGGLIVLTNLRSVLGSAGVDGPAVPAVHLAVAVLSVGLVTRAALRLRAAPQTVGATDVPSSIPVDLPSPAPAR